MALNVIYIEAYQVDIRGYTRWYTGCLIDIQTLNSVT